MHIVDFYPSQGSFSPGAAATLLIDIEATASENISLQISIRHLTEKPLLLDGHYQI
jgi:hypothetical protein